MDESGTINAFTSLTEPNTTYGSSLLSMIRTQTRECLSKLESYRNQNPLCGITETGIQRIINGLCANIMAGDEAPVNYFPPSDVGTGYNSENYLTDMNSCGCTAPFNTPRSQLVPNKEIAYGTASTSDQNRDLDDFQNWSCVARDEQEMLLTNNEFKASSRTHMLESPMSDLQSNSSNRCSSKISHNLTSRSFPNTNSFNQKIAQFQSGKPSKFISGEDNLSYVSDTDKLQLLNALPSNISLAGEETNAETYPSLDKKLPDNTNFYAFDCDEKNALGGLLTVKKVQLHKVKHVTFQMSKNSFIEDEQIEAPPLPINTTVMHVNPTNQSLLNTKTIRKNNSMCHGSLDSHSRSPRRALCVNYNPVKHKNPKYRKIGNALYTTNVYDIGALNDNGNSEDLVNNETPDESFVLTKDKNKVSEMIYNPQIYRNASDCSMQEKNSCKIGVTNPKTVKSNQFRKSFAKHQSVKHALDTDRSRISKYTSDGVKHKIQPLRFSQPFTMSWLYRSMVEKSLSLLKSSDKKSTKSNKKRRVKHLASKAFCVVAQRNRKKGRKLSGALTKDQHRLATVPAASPYENMRTLMWEKCMNGETSANIKDRKTQTDVNSEPETEMSVYPESDDVDCESSEDINSQTLSLSCVSNNSKDLAVQKQNAKNRNRGPTGNTDSESKRESEGVRRNNLKKCPKDTACPTSSPRITVTLERQVSNPINKSTSSQEKETGNSTRSQIVSPALNTTQPLTCQSSRHSLPTTNGCGTRVWTCHLSQRSPKKTSVQPSCTKSSVNSFLPKKIKKHLLSSPFKGKHKSSFSKRILVDKTNTDKFSSRNNHREKKVLPLDRNEVSPPQTDKFEPETKDMTLAADSGEISLIMENFGEVEILAVLEMLGRSHSQVQEGVDEEEILNSQTNEMKIEAHERLIDCTKWFIRNNGIVIEKLNRAIESVDVDLDEPRLEWPLPRQSELSTFPLKKEETADIIQAIAWPLPVNKLVLDQNQHVSTAKRSVTQPYENSYAKKAKAVNNKQNRTMDKETGACDTMTSMFDLKSNSDSKAKLINKTSTSIDATFFVLKEKDFAGKKRYACKVKPNKTNSEIRQIASDNQSEQGSVNSGSFRSLGFNSSASSKANSLSTNKESKICKKIALKNRGNEPNRTSKVFPPVTISNATSDKDSTVISRKDVTDVFSKGKNPKSQCNFDKNVNLNATKFCKTLSSVRVYGGPKPHPNLNQESRSHGLDPVYSIKKSMPGERETDLCFRPNLNPVEEIVNSTWNTSDTQETLSSPCEEDISQYSENGFDQTPHKCRPDADFDHGAPETHVKFLCGGPVDHKSYDRPASVAPLRCSSEIISQSIRNVYRPVSAGSYCPLLISEKKKGHNKNDLQNTKFENCERQVCWTVPFDVQSEQSDKSYSNTNSKPVVGFMSRRVPTSEDDRESLSETTSEEQAKPIPLPRDNCKTQANVILKKYDFKPEPTTMRPCDNKLNLPTIINSDEIVVDFSWLSTFDRNPISVPVPSSVDKPLSKSSFENWSTSVPKFIDSPESESKSVSSEESKDEDQETIIDPHSFRYDNPKSIPVSAINPAKKISWAEYLGQRDFQPLTCNVACEEQGTEVESIQDVYRPRSVCLNTTSDATKLSCHPQLPKEPVTEDILLTGTAMTIHNRKNSLKLKTPFHSEVACQNTKPNFAPEFANSTKQKSIHRQDSNGPFTRSTTTLERKDSAPQIWSHVQNSDTGSNHSLALLKYMNGKADKSRKLKATPNKKGLPFSDVSPISMGFPHIKTLTLDGFECGLRSFKLNGIRSKPTPARRKSVATSKPDKNDTKKSWKGNNSEIRKRVAFVSQSDQPTVEDDMTVRGFPFSNLYRKDHVEKVNRTSVRNEIEDDLQKSGDFKSPPAKKLSFLRELLAIDRRLKTTTSTI